ncbi:MAG: ABC transporter permease subunit [Candidatus Saccharibacteria bacterium]
MNIFKQELSQQRRPALLWIAALCGLSLLFFSVYPAFTKEVTSSKVIISNLPSSIRNALDISLADFFTFFGFYSYIFLFVLLAGSIFAMNLVLSILSKEESAKTTDFLLSKPITRNKILIEKISSSLCVIFLVYLAYIMFAFLGSQIITNESFSVKTFFLINFRLILVGLFFFSLGLLLSVLLKKIRSVLTISLSVVFAFFIVNLFGSVIGEDRVRYLTPFKFFDPRYIVSHQSYEINFLIIDLLFIFASIAVSFIIFNKKNIRSAV